MGDIEGCVVGLDGCLFILVGCCDGFGEFMVVIGVCIGGV